MKKHGMSHTPEYRAWKEIKRRCLNSRSHGFKRYGGRGITICDEWKDDFQAFYDHIGPKPGCGYSVERINNDRGYEPRNVKWATAHEQSRNKRSNHKLTARGITRTIVDWSKTVGISSALISYRVNRLGWPAEKALFTSVTEYHRHS